MPEIQEGSAGPAPMPEPLRVLMPSPIGPLGLELQGAVVTRLLIAPGDRERAAAAKAGRANAANAADAANAGNRARFEPLHKLAGSETLDEIFGRLSEYFTGARRRIEIEIDLAPCGLDSLSRRVLKETCKIPYGRTRTYQEIAETTGRPDAYRQVLSILLENPIPILIPCHRVVTHRGGSGSYIGGSARKKWLLDLESRREGDGEPL